MKDLTKGQSYEVQVAIMERIEHLRDLSGDGQEIFYSSITDLEQAKKVIKYNWPI